MLKKIKMKFNVIFTERIIPVPRSVSLMLL